MPAAVYVELFSRHRKFKHASFGIEDIRFLEIGVQKQSYQILNATSVYVDVGLWKLEFKNNHMKSLHATSGNLDIGCSELEFKSYRIKF